MASTSKCPFCGGVVRSNERTCPHCGAENKLYIEDTPRTIHRPRTIDELKEYCAERGMPLLRMRFFIGEDFQEPKAFGIYRDGKNVVVYKNKADGSRAIRYQGPDEERGVGELFQKLLDECHNRGIYPDGKPVTRSAGGSGSSSVGSGRSRTSSRSSEKEALGFLLGMAFIVVLLLAMVLGSARQHRNDGYYQASDNTVYYRDGGDWYVYDPDGGAYDWYEVDGFPHHNPEDYLMDSGWENDWDGIRFSDGSVWTEHSSSGSNSSDSWSSSDYDSWDSGGTDWDSDW